MTQEKKRSLVKDKKNLWLMILLLSVVVIEIWWWQREKLTVDLDSLKHNVAGVPASTPAPLPPTGVVLTDVSGVVNAAKPSVVTVAVQTTQLKRSGNMLSPLSLMFGWPGLGDEDMQLEQEDVQRDIGTGFVVDNSGLVVTNKHVVSGMGKKYVVIDSDDQEYEVSEIYRDSDHDLALLQVAGLANRALTLGNSDDLQVGQGVVAIGTALGEFRHTVTTGVVSGLGRTITASDALGRDSETIRGIIQTDAAINAGNSGGPLLNSMGQVIGVNVAMSSGAENIGFALPIKVVQESLALFESTGRFERPFLGVEYRMISAKAALLNEIPQGAYLTAIAANSPAAKAGLQVGDIITKFAGESLKTEKKDGSSNLLTAIINKHKIGEQVEIEYYRADERQVAQAVLQKRSE